MDIVCPAEVVVFISGSVLNGIVLYTASKLEQKWLLIVTEAFVFYAHTSWPQRTGCGAALCSKVTWGTVGGGLMFQLKGDVSFGACLLVFTKRKTSSTFAGLYNGHIRMRHLKTSEYKEWFQICQ